MGTNVLEKGERVFTFASLPAFNLKIGQHSIITDGGTLAYGGTAVGGGTNMVRVWWNGANWVFG